MSSGVISLESVVSQDLKEQFNRLKDEFSMFSALFEVAFPAQFQEPPSTLTEAQDWVSRVVTNGGTVSSRTESAVEAFVTECKAGSIWTKLKRINLFAGTGLAACAVPLVVGSGSAVDTLTNFVSGDYSESSGLTGNATTKFCNTGFLASALTSNSSHLTVVANTATAVDGVHGANAGAASYFGMYAPFTDGIYYSYQYNQSTGQGRLAATGEMLPGGVITSSRNASNSHAVYANGRILGSNTTTGGTLPARAIYLFAANSSGTATNFRADTLLGYTIGDGLSAAEAKLLSTALQRFNMTLSRGDFFAGSVSNATTLNGPEDILIDGNYAYIPCRDGGSLAVVDISNPYVPTIAASFTNAALTEGIGVAKNGNTLYLTSWHNRTLLCIDATNPLSMTLLGSVQIGNVEGGGDPDELRKVVYSGGYCYCTHSHDQKVYVVDVSNPASPSVVGNVALGVDPFAIAKSGNYLFVTPFPGTSMKVIDVSTPASPTVVTSITCPSGVGGLEVSGTKLYACGFSDNKLECFDITTPASISSLGSITSASLGAPNRVHVLGNRAYLAASSTDSIAVVDVTNAASMSFVKSRGGAFAIDRCYDVALSGGLVYAVGRDTDSFATFGIN